MTGALTRMEVRGRDGALLRDVWANEGPVSYLGLAVAGFPNLFTVQGPGSPAAATNFVSALEQHIEWIGDCIAYLKADGYRTIDAPPDAQREWIEHTTSLVAPTVLVHPTCNSWYNGANVPGKKRMYMGYTAGIPEYRRRCDEIADGGYAASIWREENAASTHAHRWPPSSAGCCRGRWPHSGRGRWNQLSGRGMRQVAEVALDELVVTGMTLMSSPPKLARPVEDYAGVAAELAALGVAGVHREPEPLQVKEIRPVNAGVLSYERMSYDHDPRWCLRWRRGHDGPAGAEVVLFRHDAGHGPGWSGCTVPARAG